MASRSKLVNLDAMIKREDFSTTDSEASSFETVSTISLRDFTKGSLIGLVILPFLRGAHSRGQSNASSNTSAGVLKPSVFRGLVFNLLAISSS